MKSFYPASATTGREILVAHPTRGVSTWLLTSIVVLLAVTCVYSNPTITCPEDKTESAVTGGSTKSVTLTTPTATGDTTQCDKQSPSIFSIGTTAVTCTATTVGDGNKATCVYYVIITDDEDPTITNIPEDVRVSISLKDWTFPNARAVATWQAPVTIDNSNLVTLSSTHQSGEKFPIGDTTVTYTATDRAGNTAQESFHVRVLAKPPDDDIFVVERSTEDSCLTIFWPEAGDQETKSYGLFFWKEGDPKPSSERRQIQVADTSKTYIENNDQCNLPSGVLYNFEVHKEPASAVVGSLQFWTRPKMVQFLSPNTDMSTVNTSFDVSWELSSDNVDQYLLCIGNDKQYFTKSTDHTSIEGIHPGTSLQLNLSALVGSGDMRQEGFINSLDVTTAQPAPGELIVYNYTESTVAVAWVESNINMELLSSEEPFMVFINPKGTEESFQIITASPLEAEFTGLEPNTNFEIRVIHNLMQLSLTTTQKTRPVRATNVRLTDVQSSSITLEWEGSTEGVKYELYISPGETDPIAVAETRHTFSQLKNDTEHFIKIVSVYDGVKSVPQTFLVTTGVTKPTVPSNGLTTVVIVAAVLGCVALVLAFVILIACIKLRRLQKNSSQGPARAGHTNKAMDKPGPSRGGNPGKQEQQDYGGEYAVPGELGDIAENKPRSDYQNATVFRMPWSTSRNK